MINNSSLNDLVIGIVTFNPSKQSIDRIRWLTSIGLKVFIFDNSDLAKKGFDDHPDPKSLFPFRSYAHYNVKGYKFVSDFIYKELNQ